MIGRLRKKFIVAAILAVFLVLLLLIGSINLLNYRSMVAEADETLQILSANNGLRKAGTGHLTPGTAKTGNSPIRAATLRPGLTRTEAVCA